MPGPTRILVAAASADAAISSFGRVTHGSIRCDIGPAKAAGRPINPTDGAYSEAMEIAGFHRLVFVSGQVPVDANQRVPATFREQARLAWANVARQLAQAGMSVRNIVKMTIFLSDRRYRGEPYEVRHEVLGDHRPAMTIVICGIYRENWRLEIEAVAAD